MARVRKNKLVKKPDFFVYGLFRIASLFVSYFIFNLQVKRNEIRNKKGPYVVLGNHESFIDFINLCSCNRHRMNFIVSNSFYQSMKIHPLIKACGTIPKQQFQTSFHDLKAMKSVIDNNWPLVLYPAGLMSENGITTPIPKATAKALKWLNCDVYIAKTEGSYLTNPKWGKCGFRKGQITLDIYKLYTKEDVYNLNENEIQKTIENHLYYSVYDYQEKNLIKYKKGDNIEGLNNVLYQCLKCNEEFSMIANKNKLTCTCCNNTAIADKYGFLHPEKDKDIVLKKPSEWSLKIKDQLSKIINEDENYKLTSKAQIGLINYQKHQFDISGEANISLSREGFYIDGILNQEKVNILLSTKEFYILPFSPGKHFEIQNGSTIYRIYLENGIEVTKWINALAILYNIHHKTKETVK